MPHQMNLNHKVNLNAAQKEIKFMHKIKYSNDPLIKLEG